VKRIILRDWESRALQAGRLTQLRRLVKTQPIPFQPNYPNPPATEFEHVGKPWMPVGGVFQDRWPCPLGGPGSRLWVAETWNVVPVGRPAPLCGTTGIPESLPDGWGVLYRASGDVTTKLVGWRPSIHMPRWASRSIIELTAVRVERVQDVTEEDAKKCGVPSDILPADVSLMPYPTTETQGRYAARWIADHGQASWDRNDWVWVYDLQEHNSTTKP